MPLGLALGCASVPGTSPSYEVSSAESRGPYLEALLEWTSSLAAVSSDAKITLLFPASDACGSILVPGTAVDYLPAGMTGTVRVGERSCASVGIARLREWRDRRPRPRTAQVIPRAQASYRIVSEADGYALVRGRFPLAGLLGWAGGEDTLALVPRSDVCAPVLERGVASMEYRASGRLVLTLVGNAGQCPLHGFARPQDS